MKIVSCPIPGRSVIVQFEAAAAGLLEKQANRQPFSPSHGLLLGSSRGTDPSWLSIHRMQPIFGIGDSSDSSGSVTSSRVDLHGPMITLGYYTIRSKSDNLNQSEREFLATSLPRAASLALVITANPDRRMMAQFYLRNSHQEFAPHPDYRYALVPQEAPR
jgi:hypothetical protein